MRRSIHNFDFGGGGGCNREVKARHLKLMACVSTSVSDVREELALETAAVTYA
jgi:hypothetical protein